MVTSNKQSDKKVFKMTEKGTAAVVPQRTLLGEVNGNITCPLCRGYYIDATTIVECLHSFCRSCIIKHLQVKSYCPVCEMMINSAKPNIKLDKALQDIVYKLVPGLFQKEMERRQQFYASRPGPAASATPEQRGEDTERIIFSPEDVISFSLEYADATDTDSISSKSSDSNEPQPTTTRRYLQCPAVVNISHLKKFLSMKFDIDSTQFAIDILYKRVPLPDYYTLMDIAYIYNWKRNEPMRFFYQIIDYVAIRNRLFEVNRKDTTSCPFRKSSPASTEDTNVSSPALHLNDEVSSGTDSPMLDENVKQCNDASKKHEKVESHNKESVEGSKNSSASPKKNDDEVEKSQFLNSFELTAKSNCLSKSPVKGSDETLTSDTPKVATISLKEEEKTAEPTKRKQQGPPQTPEIKKLKIEIDRAKVSTHLTSSSHSVTNLMSPSVTNKPQEKTKIREADGAFKYVQSPPQSQSLPTGISNSTKEIKAGSATLKPDVSGVKRAVSGPSNITSPKRKLQNESSPSTQAPPGVQKTMSPMKQQTAKPEGLTNVKLFDTPKSALKKMPDLKPSGSIAQSSQNKIPQVNKVRMDLLANNSDPTIDRSKILSQVKSSLGTPPPMPSSGDPLKSLFDSCQINIPSSLSITLTDQKLEGKPEATSDPRKCVTNKSVSTVANASHKVPSPPVHNYIEILKLPDVEAKTQAKSENSTESKPSIPSKSDATPTQSKPSVKSSEGSAKGPVPNLKPISDTKLAKQSGNFSSPITFQQTFEQQLQSMQTDKKPKLPKNKAQVPKLVPATPKSFSVANKSPNPINKPSGGAGNMPSLETKSTAALDLTTPHTIQQQAQIGQQQTFNKKAFEAMQSIDSLAKKQNLPTKSMPLSMAQSNSFSSTMSNRPLQTNSGLLRIPSTPNMHQLKQEKNNSGSGTQMHNRQDISSGKASQIKSANNNSPTLSPSYQMTSHSSPSTAQPSPRSHTRSPSSSPKLVIAEEKQTVGSSLEQNMNQSNQVTSTQISSLNVSNNDAHKSSPGPSTKSVPKAMGPSGKLPGMLQPMNPSLKSKPTMNPSAAEYLMSQTRPQLMPHHHALLRHQMEMNAWLKAQRQLDMIKNMSSMAHQGQNDFNNKDKQ